MAISEISNWQSNCMANMLGYSSLFKKEKRDIVELKMVTAALLKLKSFFFFFNQDLGMTLYQH